MWKLLNKVIALALTFSLILQQSGFSQVPLQIQLPAYINGYVAADRFRPVQLRSINFDPGKQNFNLFLDKGDQIEIKPGQLTRDAKLLMQYFRIGLALPNDTFWVNLRPDAADQIIDPFLEKTDVGQVMLAADLQLKKDLANFTSPNNEEGRLYWDKLYAKADTLFNEQSISIPTLTRPWIVPGEVIIRETNSGCHIFKASLKVCLEQDYIKDSKDYNFNDPRLKELNDLSSQLIRELIIPKLTREVNSSQKYASLRQVYYSLILAQWFKEKFRGQQGEYARNIDGFDLNGLTSARSWQKEKYFNAYKKSFKKGEYNLSENRFTAKGASVRQYFSGGIKYANLLPLTTGLTNTLPDGGAVAGLRIRAADDATLDPANELVQLTDGGDIVKDKTAQPPTEAGQNVNSDLNKPEKIKPITPNPTFRKALRIVTGAAVISSIAAAALGIVPVGLSAAIVFAGANLLLGEVIHFYADESQKFSLTADAAAALANVGLGLITSIGLSSFLHLGIPAIAIIMVPAFAVGLTSFAIGNHFPWEKIQNPAQNLKDGGDQAPVENKQGNIISRSLIALGEKIYNPIQAGRYIGILKDRNSNRYQKRDAAEMLGKFKDERAIEPLIDYFILEVMGNDYDLIFRAAEDPSYPDKFSIVALDSLKLLGKNDRDIEVILLDAYLTGVYKGVKISPLIRLNALELLGEQYGSTLSWNKLFAIGKIKDNSLAESVNRKLKKALPKIFQRAQLDEAIRQNKIAADARLDKAGKDGGKAEIADFEKLLGSENLMRQFVNERFSKRIAENYAPGRLLDQSLRRSLQIFQKAGEVDLALITNPSDEYNARLAKEFIEESMNKDGGDMEIEAAAREGTMSNLGFGDLVAALNHPFIQVQRGALKALKELGEFTPEMKLVILVELLSNPDSKIRWEAAVELAKLGKLTKSLKIIRYVADLRDKESSVRLSAVEGLAEIGDPDTSEALALSLRDADSAVRQAAAEALEKLRKSTRALKEIRYVADLSDPDSAIRLKAAKALAELFGPKTSLPLPKEAAPADPKTKKALENALADKDIEIRKAAAEALGNIGDPHTVGALLKALKDNKGDDAVRLPIVVALGKIGHPRAIGPLQDITIVNFSFKDLFDIKDRLAVQYRNDAAVALSSLVGVQAEKKVPLYIEDMDDLSNEIRFSAIAGLIGIGQPAVEPLIKKLPTSNSALLQAETTVLVEIGQPAAEPLSQFLQDRNNDNNLRRLAAEMLGDIGRTKEIGRPAIQGLIDTLDDTIKEVGNAAAAALIRTGQQAVQPLSKVQGDILIGKQAKNILAQIAANEAAKKDGGSESEILNGMVEANLAAFAGNGQWKQAWLSGSDIYGFSDGQGRIQEMATFYTPEAHVGWMEFVVVKEKVFLKYFPGEPVSANYKQIENVLNETFRRLAAGGNPGKRPEVIDDVDSPNLIKKGLKSKYTEERESSARKLGMMHATITSDDLEEALKTETDRRVRYAIAYALGQVNRSKLEGFIDSMKGTKVSDAAERALSDLKRNQFRDGGERTEEQVKRISSILTLSEDFVRQAIAESINKTMLLNDFAETVGIKPDAALKNMAAAGMAVARADGKSFDLNPDFFSEAKLNEFIKQQAASSSNPAMVDLTIIRIERIINSSLNAGELISKLSLNNDPAAVVDLLLTSKVLPTVMQVWKLDQAKKSKDTGKTALTTQDIVSDQAGEFYRANGVGIVFSFPQATKVNSRLLKTLRDYQQTVMEDMAQGEFNYRGTGTRQTVEEFFNEYFVGEWYGKIRSFVEKEFNGGKSLKAIVTNGIGANDQFMWSLVEMYNRNRPAGAPVWYHIVTARDLEKLKDLDPKTTLSIEISRSGSTWEGVEAAVRMVNKGFTKRITLANGGALVDIAKAPGVTSLIIGMSPDIGGRNMPRKTAIYYTVETVIGMFFPRMGSSVFAGLNHTFDEANDFANQKNAAIAGGEIIHAAMELLGVEHIALATNSKQLGLTGSAWSQYIMEGSNKEDVISLSMHDLIKEPAYVLENLSRSPAGKISMVMALLDKAAPAYDSDLARVEELKKRMPVMVFTVDSREKNSAIDVADGISQKQEAAFDILWTDMVTVLTSLLRVDANSNPNVKVVREMTASYVAKWKETRDRYSADPIGRKETDVLMSIGNPGTEEDQQVATPGKQKAIKTSQDAADLGREVARQLRDKGLLEGRNRLNIFYGAEGLESLALNLRNRAYAQPLGKIVGWIMDTGIYPLRAHKGHEATLAHSVDPQRPLLGDKTVNIFLNVRKLGSQEFYNEPFKDITGQFANVNGANVHQTNDSMTLPNIQRAAQVSPTILFEFEEMTPEIEAKLEAFYTAFIDEIAASAQAGKKDGGEVEELIQEVKQEISLKKNSPKQDYTDISLFQITPKNQLIVKIDDSETLTITYEIFQKFLTQDLPVVMLEYDLRGKDGFDKKDKTNRFTKENLVLLGMLLGSASFDSHHGIERLNPGDVYPIAGDNGPSTENFRKYLGAGLQITGVNVLDLGLVNSGQLYSSIARLGAQGGSFVTRSHVEVGTNGFKPIVGKTTLYGDMIKELGRQAEKGLRIAFSSDRGVLIDATDKTQGIGEQVKRIYMLKLMEEFKPMLDKLKTSGFKFAVDLGSGSATTLKDDIKRIFGDVQMFRDTPITDPTDVAGLADPSRDDLAALKHPGSGKDGKSLMDWSRDHPDTIIFCFDLDMDRMGIVQAGKLYKGDLLFYPVIEYLLTMAKEGTVNKEFYFDPRMSPAIRELIKHFGGIATVHPKGHSIIKASDETTLIEMARESGYKSVEEMIADNGFKIFNIESSLHPFITNESGMSIDDGFRFLFAWLDAFGQIKEKYGNPDLSLGEYVAGLKEKGIIHDWFTLPEQRTPAQNTVNLEQGPYDYKEQVMKEWAAEVVNVFQGDADFGQVFWKDAKTMTKPFTLIDIKGVYSFETPLGIFYWGWSNTSEKVAFGSHALTRQEHQFLTKAMLSVFLNLRDAKPGLNSASAHINPLETKALSDLFDGKDILTLEQEIKNEYPTVEKALNAVKEAGRQKAGPQDKKDGGVTFTKSELRALIDSPAAFAHFLRFQEKRFNGNNLPLNPKATMSMLKKISQSQDNPEAFIWADTKAYSLMEEVDAYFGSMKYVNFNLRELDILAQSSAVFRYFYRTELSPKGSQEKMDRDARDSQQQLMIAVVERALEAAKRRDSSLAGILSAVKNAKEINMLIKAQDFISSLRGLDFNLTDELKALVNQASTENEGAFEDFFNKAFPSSRPDGESYKMHISKARACLEKLFMLTDRITATPLTKIITMAQSETQFLLVIRAQQYINYLKTFNFDLNFLRRLAEGTEDKAVLGDVFTEKGIRVSDEFLNIRLVALQEIVENMKGQPSATPTVVVMRAVKSGAQLRLLMRIQAYENSQKIASRKDGGTAAELKSWWNTVWKQYLNINRGLDRGNSQKVRRARKDLENAAQAIAGYKEAFKAADTIANVGFYGDDLNKPFISIVKGYPLVFTGRELNNMGLDAVKALELRDPEKVINLIGSKDGGLKQTPIDTGGVDFRAVPTGITAIPGINPGAGALMPKVSLEELGNQWKEIQHAAQNAELPYEKMKQFVGCCKAQEEAVSLKQEVIAYVANLLKLEEERAIATPSQLKEIVALVVA
jgi:HEAT repeat protein/phosphomannomutase